MYLFIIHVVGKVDENRILALTALNDVARDATEREKYEQQLEKKDPALSELKNYSSQLSRYLVTNCSDLFVLYCKDIVKAALKSNRELLKAKEFNIRYDEIEKFRSINDFRNHIIEKKISSIVETIDDIEDEITKLVHIEKIFQSNVLLKIFLNIRNIYVHNKGIVDDKFIKKSPEHEEFNFVKGKRFHVDFEKFILLSNNCINSAYQIDELISKKHKIQRRKSSYWDAKKNKAT